MNFFNQAIVAAQTTLGSLLPTCRAAAKAQSAALDRPLPPLSRLGLWLHLLLCRWCRRYGRQIRFLRAAARNHSDELAQAASPPLSPAARVRIQQRLQSEK